MNVETVVRLNRFKPRDYQLKIWQALERGFKYVMAIIPRRAGKDMAAWNWCIRECIRKVGVIYYIFPTYAQGKKVIFDSITNDGRRVLDFIPEELIASINHQELKVRFKNGSILQVVGSNDFDSLMGTNPMGCVFSEYALQDPRAFQFIRPILAANNGWALFISTPRGKNHLWELYQIALHNPDHWYQIKLTLDDTQHIPLEEIERDRQMGIMSEDMIQQEYYTSFTMGVEGAYYAKTIDRMRLNGQIGQVPWEPSFKVHTALDLGWNDPTAVIFFQIIGQTIKIIDYYENSKKEISDIVNIINSKPYSYGKHIGPHDLDSHHLGMPDTRLAQFRNLGMNFIIADKKVLIIDGIESVRATMAKVWIDDVRCAGLIKALENYRQEYDNKTRVYKGKPLHDWASHGSDAMRYLSVGLPYLRETSSPAALEQRYKQALYGGSTINSNLPGIFHDDGYNQYR